MSIDFQRNATFKNLDKVHEYLTGWTALDGDLAEFSSRVDHAVLHMKLNTVAIQVRKAVATHIFKSSRFLNGEVTRNFHLEVTGKTTDGYSFTLSSDLHRTTFDNGATWERPWLPPAFILEVEGKTHRTVDILVQKQISAVRVPNPPCCFL